MKPCLNIVMVLMPAILCSCHQPTRQVEISIQLDDSAPPSLHDVAGTIVFRNTGNEPILLPVHLIVPHITLELQAYPYGASEPYTGMRKHDWNVHPSFMIPDTERYIVLNQGDSYSYTLPQDSNLVYVHEYPAVATRLWLLKAYFNGFAYEWASPDPVPHSLEPAIWCDYVQSKPLMLLLDVPLGR